MKEKLILYPTNWLYNASLIGFMKVIAHGIGENKVHTWLNDDGTLQIERNILSTSLTYYKQFNVDNGNKEIPLVGKNRFFPNYLQKNQEKGFENLIENLGNISLKDNVSCGLCYQNYFLDQTYNLSKDAKDILGRISYEFNVVHSSSLAPSKGLFPNSFWNMESSIRICPLCSYLIVFSQIPFIKTNEGEIFINSQSLQTMWYLNKYISSVFNKDTLKELFASSLMSFSQKINKTLGLWSSFNIEMVIKTYKNKSISYSYYALPAEIVRILLNKDVSALIARSKEPVVLELILSGKHDMLMKLSDHIMRNIKTGKPNQNDNFILQLKNRNISHLKELSGILPELYIKIDNLLKS